MFRVISRTTVITVKTQINVERGTSTMHMHMKLIGCVMRSMPICVLRSSHTLYGKKTRAAQRLFRRHFSHEFYKTQSAGIGVNRFPRISYNRAYLI